MLTFYSERVDVKFILTWWDFRLSTVLHILLVPAVYRVLQLPDYEHVD